MLRDECEGVVAEGESLAVGLGVEGKVLVRHKSHGVAQVQLADVDGALGGENVVDPEGAVVVGCDVGEKPVFEGGFHGRGVADDLLDFRVGKQKVGPVDPLLGLEEGIADELKGVVVDVVFEGEVGLYLTPRLGDDAALGGNDFFEPLEVEWS